MLFPKEDSGNKSFDLIPCFFMVSYEQIDSNDQSLVTSVDTTYEQKVQPVVVKSSHFQTGFITWHEDHLTKWILPIYNLISVLINPSPNFKQDFPARLLQNNVYNDARHHNR